MVDKYQTEFGGGANITESKYCEVWRAAVPQHEEV